MSQQSNEDRHVELAQDNWIAIFSFLAASDKIIVSQVCKEWRSLIMHPLFWKSVEATLRVDKRRTSLFGQFQCLLDFITKYCPSLVDLHLSVPSRMDLPDNWLDHVFRISTLQRLAVVQYGNSSLLIYVTTEISPCSALRILNLRHVNIDFKTLQLICENLPNLEEFYMPDDFMLTKYNCHVLQQAKNLRTLYTHQVDTRGQPFINACPSLKFLLYSRGHNTNAAMANDDYCRVIKNTVVSSIHVLDVTREHHTPELKLEMLKKVAPLITQYSWGYIENVLVPLASNFKKNKPIIEYLVKELHFDLNAAYEPYDCFYRPSFTYCPINKREGLEYMEKYPIEAVISQGDLSDVQEIVRLGASVECPETNRSFLTLAYKADVRLFLLERGANPIKSIDTKEFLPVYAYMFMDPRFEDSREVVMELNETCYFGIEVMDKSLLYWAIRDEKWKSVDAMLEIGLKLYDKEISKLIDVNPKKFLDYVNSKTIDIMSLSPSTALQLIRMDWGPVIAPYINENMNVVVDDGYTLFHYMCMEGNQMELPGLEARSDGEKYRWKLMDPECSWRRSEKKKKIKNVRKDRKKAKPILVDNFSDGEDEFDQSLNRDSDDDEAYEYEPSISRNLREREFNDWPKESDEHLTLKIPATISVIKPDVTILTKDGKTGLLLICKANFIPQEAIRRIEEQLSYGVDINQPDNYGCTPLHALCYSQSWEAARLLLQKGAHMNVRDSHGVTPFMAAIYGYKCVADEKNPHSFTDNLLSLIGASTAIEVNATEKLFGHKDADGFTPLHLAVMYGNNDVIKTLIENGADVNAQTNSLRLTPLMVLMQILSVFKTSVCSDQVPSNVPYFKYLETFNTIPRMRHCWRSVESVAYSIFMDHGYSYCHGLSATNLIRCDEMLDLLTSSADLTLTDVNQNTYLHFLIILYGDNFSGLTLWLNKHKSLNQMWNNKNDNNESSFYLLCSQLKKSKVYNYANFLYNLVPKCKIDIMERPNAGTFPFNSIAAAKWKSFSWEKWASLPGVDLSAPLTEQQHPDFFTALWAEQRATVAMLKEMLEKTPAYLNGQDHCGQTFLMRLIRQIVSGDKKLDALAIILAYKPHLNIQDVNGNTALHIACQYFHLGAVDSIRCGLKNAGQAYFFFITPFMLLDAGADPTIKNNRGETPLSYVPSLMKYYESLYKWTNSRKEKLERWRNDGIRE